MSRDLSLWMSRRIWALEHMAFISSATYLNGCPAPVGLWGGLGAQVMHTAHDKHSGSQNFCGEQELQQESERHACCVAVPGPILESHVLSDLEGSDSELTPDSELPRPSRLRFASPRRSLSAPLPESTLLSLHSSGPGGISPLTPHHSYSTLPPTLCDSQ